MWWHNFSLFQSIALGANHGAGVKQFNIEMNSCSDSDESRMTFMCAQMVGGSLYYQWILFFFLPDARYQRYSESTYSIIILTYRERHSAAGWSMLTVDDGKWKREGQYVYILKRKR